MEPERKEIWQGRKTHCINGHRFTQKTTAVKIYDDGHIVRRCRVCQSERDKARYRCNPARREAVRERARNFYLSQNRNIFSEANHAGQNN